MKREKEMKAFVNVKIIGPLNAGWFSVFSKVRVFFIANDLC